MKLRHPFLISLNILLLLYVVYLLAFGESGPSFVDHIGRGNDVYVRFQFPFLLGVLSLLLIPIVIFFKTKNTYWLCQTFFILVCVIFWRSNIVQSTILVNSSTSMYKKMNAPIAFIDLNRNNVSDVINYIEENIGTDTLKSNHKNERIRITNNSIRKEIHIGFRNKDYHKLIDGKLTRVSEHLEIIDTLCEFQFPPSISVKMKGLKINHITIQNNQINKCILVEAPVKRSFNNKYSNSFWFFPHGRESSVENKGHLRNYFLYYEASYYRRHHCSSRHYYIDDYWSFNIISEHCFG